METIDFPETLLEAVTYFSCPERAHAYLKGVLWPNGVKCPHCGSEKVSEFTGKRKLSKCRDCRKQFTIKIGTIFEKSPLGLDKWLPAIWLISCAKNGISSCELARSLGVTQKSAWFMGHRIRRAIEIGNFKKMEGIVEVDETYIGGKAKNMHKSVKKRKGISPGGFVGKTMIMGFLERGNAKGESRVQGEVLPFLSREVSIKKAREYVLTESEIHTDSGPHYSRLKNEYVHKVVDHNIEYVREGVHTNGLENFWNLVKRSIGGTYTFCAPFHLHRYLTEHMYRFNERKLDDAGRFTGALQQVTGKRLMYQTLISRK